MQRFSNNLNIQSILKNENKNKTNINYNINNSILHLDTRNRYYNKFKTGYIATDTFLNVDGNFSATDTSIDLIDTDNLYSDTLVAGTTIYKINTDSNDYYRSFDEIGEITTITTSDNTNYTVTISAGIKIAISNTNDIYYKVEGNTEFSPEDINPFYCMF